jgi:hypothetical protein
MPTANHKRVKIGEFGVTVQAILDEYKDMTSEKMNVAVNETAKEVQKKTKQQSASNLGGTGKYAKGWSVRKIEDTYAHHRRTIYHGTLPGLPHLLEHGHGGPRPAGPHPHIVQDDETEQIFEKNVQKALAED